MAWSKILNHFFNLFQTIDGSSLSENQGQVCYLLKQRKNFLAVHLCFVLRSQLLSKIGKTQIFHCYPLVASSDTMLEDPPKTYISNLLDAKLGLCQSTTAKTSTFKIAGSLAKPGQLRRVPLMWHRGQWQSCESYGGEFEHFKIYASVSVSVYWG